MAGGPTYRLPTSLQHLLKCHSFTVDVFDLSKAAPDSCFGALLAPGHPEPGAGGSEVDTNAAKRHGFGTGQVDQVRRRSSLAGHNCNSGGVELRAGAAIRHRTTSPHRAANSAQQYAFGVTRGDRTSFS